jgi:hypothetical protein
MAKRVVRYITGTRTIKHDTIRNDTIRHDYDVLVNMPNYQLRHDTEVSNHVVPAQTLFHFKSSTDLEHL